MINKIKKPQFWVRFHDWIVKHQTVAYIIAGLGLIVAASLVTLALLYQKPVAMAPLHFAHKTAPAVVTPKYYSPLTGEEVGSDADTKAPVTAIMIENSP